MFISPAIRLISVIKLIGDVLIERSVPKRSAREYQGRNAEPGFPIWQIAE